METVFGIRQFRVLARNPNDLLDIYSLTVYCVEKSTLGIEDTVLTDFTVYPNPVRDVLNIRLQNNSVKKVTVYNMNGQKVFESRNSGIEHVNLSRLSSGIYISKIETDDGKVGTKKIIKI